MAKVQHMVMGLQSSGKTTFAAALWYLVDSREIETVLVKGRHNGEFRYLEEISGTWADGWQARRTASGELELIRINLRHPGGENEVDLHFVDLSGETFEQIFATRAVDEQVAELLQEINGLLLFVTTLRPRDDIAIVDVGMAIPGVMVETGRGEDAPASKEEMGPDQSEFVPSGTPQQVQLVDLLDSFSEPPISMRPSKIVVIVSAWEKAPSHLIPKQWLQDRMPLLFQYLQTHEEETPFRVYGVSAQGGTLPKKGEGGKASDRARLIKIGRAGERIQVVGYDAGVHDLTHPVRWLSGLESD